MGNDELEQDRLAMWLSFKQEADLPHVQIHSLGRLIGPTIISEQT
jgi:hypothetical protein